MNKKAEYSVIVSIHFLNHFLIFSLPVLLLYLRNDISLNYTSTGYLWTILITVMTLFSLVTGYLADKYPEKRYIQIFVGLIIMISIWSLLRFGDSIQYFAILFFFFGFGAAAFHPPSFAMITQLFEEDKAKALSFNMLAGLFANAVSPVVFAYLEKNVFGNWQDVTTAITLVALVFALLTLIIVYRGDTVANSRIEDDEIKSNTQNEWKKDILFLFSPLIIIPLLFISLRSSLFRTTSLFTAFLYEDYLNLSEYEASIATALILGFSSLFILAGGSISDKTHPKYAILVTSIGTLISAIALIIVVNDNNIITFSLSYFSLLAFYYIGPPAANALLADRVGKEQRGKVFGASFSIGQVLGVLAPTLFGYLNDTYSLQTAFILIVGLALFACALGLYIYLEEGNRNRKYEIVYKG